MLEARALVHKAGGVLGRKQLEFAMFNLKYHQAHLLPKQSVSAPFCSHPPALAPVVLSHWNQGTKMGNTAGLKMGERKKNAASLVASKERNLLFKWKKSFHWNLGRQSESNRYNLRRRPKSGLTLLTLFFPK